MYVPRARPGMHVPALVRNGGLYAIAILLALVAWGVVSVARIRTDDSYLTRDALPAAIDPSSFNLIAYTTSGVSSDTIWLKPVNGGEPRALAEIPHIGLGVLYAAEVHGSASPPGDAIAVLSLPQNDVQPARSYASLSIVSVATGDVREGLGQFDSLSPVAWAPDGGRLALVRSQQPDAAGRRATAIIEVDVASGTETVVAEFSSVLAAAPVGYSVDGARLYIVTVDSGGSALHVERAGAVGLVGQLSGGLTRDWTLNSDATRLAYVEVLSASDRVYAGRTYHIGAAAPGVLPPAEGSQLGVAWRPGSPTPDFGSMDGQAWKLEPEPESPVFVRPLAWSPDGQALITSIHAVEDGRVQPRGTLELVVANRRVELEDGTRFLGFVRGG